ncbi:MAG: AMP-binding protein, partial [Candidatus Rokubacteria bacterium]|nr:AMP-binding protein [Candidatus Rokubacteria bacterium]
MTSLGGFARQQARRFGDTPLFFSGDEVVSYRGYDERTDRLAGGLARLGLRQGDRMAVLLPNGLPILEAYMGAAKVGAASVPLNPMFTPREIEYVVNNSRAKVMMASPRDAERVQAIRDRLPSLAHVVVAGEAVAGTLPYSQVASAAPLEVTAPVDGDDVAMIAYTSGTTGHPKGAMLTHAGLLDNAAAVVEAVGFRDADRSLCILPLFHVFAIAFDYLQMMTVGASSVIVERFDAGGALRLIERHRATVLVGVPTMFIYILRHPDRQR